MQIDVEKGGTLAIQVSLTRTFKGLKVLAKTTPDVEGMFRDLSANESVPVEGFSRGWIGAGLRVYHAPGLVIPGTTGYSLTAIGLPLLIPPGMGVGDFYPNLSYLRLVGISEPQGVTFTIAGVFDWEKISEASEGIKKAGQKFYRDFLLPVNVTIQISTQTTRL